MGPGKKRPSTTAISSARIAIGWLVALREDSAGSSPDTATSIMIDLCAGTCVSNDSESKSRLDGHASHCCTARLIALAIGTAASSA